MKAKEIIETLKKLLSEEEVRELEDITWKLFQDLQATTFGGRAPMSIKEGQLLISFGIFLGEHSGHIKMNPKEEEAYRALHYTLHNMLILGWLCYERQIEEETNG